MRRIVVYIILIICFCGMNVGFASIAKDRAWNEYLYAQRNEMQCRNITKIEHDGFNYVRSFGEPKDSNCTCVGGMYYHLFYYSESGFTGAKIYQCVHETKESWQNHVFWLKKSREAWFNWHDINE